MYIKSAKGKRACRHFSFLCFFCLFCGVIFLSMYPLWLVIQFPLQAHSLRVYCTPTLFNNALHCPTQCCAPRQKEISFQGLIAFHFLFPQTEIALNDWNIWIHHTHASAACTLLMVLSTLLISKLSWWPCKWKNYNFDLIGTVRKATII